MRYLKSQRQFKSQVNEGIFSKLFKKFKSKLDIKLSKSLGGTAKQIDKLFDQYKIDFEKIMLDKNDKLKAVIELGLALESGEDVKEELDKAKKANQESDKIYDKKKKLLKDKFDVKFEDIIGKEDNEDIKTYIKLKKIEMQEELLDKELNYINNDMGIDSDKINSSDMLKNLIKSKKEKMDNLQKAKKKIDEEGLGKSKKDGEKEYQTDEEIVYISKTDKKEVNAKIMDKTPKEEGNIVVSTENTPSGVEIKKDQIKEKESKEEGKEEGKEESKEK